MTISSGPNERSSGEHDEPFWTMATNFCLLVRDDTTTFTMFAGPLLCGEKFLDGDLRCRASMLNTRPPLALVSSPVVTKSSTCGAFNVVTTTDLVCL